ncbi:tetratricopeptide repeat protein [Rhodocytophaga rosea]|uniref:histidine kinase n=1 Tax=Rhodocytophaga rosea TaxID=2704465 RepID=A0A6C0GNZ5_9BACT|nr:tetratricopeptide repeat protein [Rhodocytophaga rosea]QHT69755.1 tetratricopeptide repeat protein [Rhodocytophaga rosea]
MKHLFRFLFLICLPFSMYGQNPAIDSLDRLIVKATTDTARINLRIKKLNYLNEINLDSAILEGKRNITDAQKINYSQGVANTLIRLVTSYCYKGEYAAAAQSLEMAEKIYRSLQDSTGFGNLYSSYGMMYGMQSKYDSSIYYYERAIQVASNIKNEFMLNRAYQNIAIPYQMQSNFSPALSYLQKAQDYYEKKKDIGSQTYIAMNIGLIYNNLGDIKRAEESLMKAVSLSKAAGTRNVELYAYSNLASLYEKQENHQRSHEFAMKAARLGKEMGDTGIEAASLAKSAISLAHLNQLTEAEKTAKQSILTADVSHQPYIIYQAYNALGFILKTQEKYRDAITQYEKAFDAIKEAKVYDEYVGQSYKNLSESYSGAGDYPKALAAYKKFAEIADSVRSRENIRKATELNMNYEFDKKQQLATAEQEKTNIESRNRQIMLGVGLLLMLIIAVIAFYAYYTKQKAATLLKRQKEEVEAAMTELRTTQEQLVQREKMASLGELTAGIAHEIQNPLNFVNNFSDVSVELIEELKEELDSGNITEVRALSNDIMKNLEKIYHHGKRADAIVKSMLQHSRVSSGGKQPTDLNELADEYLRLAYHGLRAKEKDFNAEFKLEADPAVGSVNVVPQEIGRVLLNLFSNAFYAVNQKKHQLNGQYQPQVIVTTKKLADKVEIWVKDNGTGIPEAVKDKIFQPFFTTKPTGEGTGLGLSLSYDIITKGHSGTLKVDSQEGEYSEFTILLPAK